MATIDNSVLSPDVELFLTPCCVCPSAAEYCASGPAVTRDSGSTRCLGDLIGINRITELSIGKVVACNPPFIQAA